MSRKPVIGFLFLLAVAGGALAWSSAERREAGRRAGIERSLLRTWAFEETALRDDAAYAGISMIRPRLDALSRDELGALAETDAFLVFRSRCSSCHAAPDPAMHPAGRWGGVVHRMERLRQKAGLMPLTVAERDSVIRFLDRAARAGAATP